MQIIDTTVEGFNDELSDLIENLREKYLQQGELTIEDKTRR